MWLEDVEEDAVRLPRRLGAPFEPDDRETNVPLSILSTLYPESGLRKKYSTQNPAAKANIIDVQNILDTGVKVVTNLWPHNTD
jgi:hypothetical protein